MKRKREETVSDHILRIARYAAALNLDQTVTQQAQTIFSEIAEKGAMRKSKMCAIHLACIYIAAKHLHRMKTMDELVATVSDSQIVNNVDIFKAMRYIQKNVSEAAFVNNSSVGCCSSSNEEKEKEDGNEVQKFVGSESVKAHLSHLSQLLRSSNAMDCEMIECAEKMAGEAAENLGICTLRATPRTLAATLLWICSHFIEKKEAADVNMVALHSVGKYTIRSAYSELLPYLPSLLPQGLLNGDNLEKLQATWAGSRNYCP